MDFARTDEQESIRSAVRSLCAGFPNEYWLNLKNGRGQRNFVLRRVEARTRKCARAGFDGVEYDVVDAYAQGHRVTGWHITARNQLVFE